jgi:hypothetical protein
LSAKSSGACQSFPPRADFLPTGQRERLPFHQGLILFFRPCPYNVSRSTNHVQGEEIIMEPLEPALLERLRTFNTPTVANAIEVFDVRPRNEGFMRPEIRCVFPRLGVMVGYAVTLKIQSVTPGAKGAALPRVHWQDML